MPGNIPGNCKLKVATLFYTVYTIYSTVLYLDEVINSQFNCMNWPSKVRHCISIFSFFMKNDQLRDLAQWQPHRWRDLSTIQSLLSELSINELVKQKTVLLIRDHLLPIPVCLCAETSRDKWQATNLLVVQNWTAVLLVNNANVLQMNDIGYNAVNKITRTKLSSRVFSSVKLEARNWASVNPWHLTGVRTSVA